MNARTERELKVRTLYRRLQRAIDGARHAIWEDCFNELSDINPNGSSTKFIDEFKEAWARSNLPNDKRDDVDTAGNYLHPAN